MLEDQVIEGSARRYAMRDLDTLRVALTYVKTRHVVVQAGGCLGVFPAYLGDLFDFVYCAEPDPELFVKMVQEVPAQNVVKLQVAFGDEHQLVSTVRRRRDGNMKREQHVGVTHVVNDNGFIPTMLIDDLALPRCDFLCLDVEGYEFNALLGASETIHRCKPVIMVEINAGIKAIGLNPDDVRTSLRMAGYELAETIRSDEIYVPSKGRK